MMKRVRSITKPPGRAPKGIGAIHLKEVQYKDEWRIEAKWRDPGKHPDPRCKKWFNNWRHAEEFAQRENKRLDEIKEKGAGRYTFNDAADSFLKRYEQLSTAKNSSGCTPDTFDIYRGIVENHLKPKFGHMRLEAISGRHVDDWVIEVSQKWSFNTAHHRLSQLRQVLGHAVDREMLHAFPASVSKVRVPGSASKRANIPDRSDLEVLRKYLNDPRPVKNARIKWSSLRVMVLLGASCGMRAGEVAALRWDSIDRENGDIYVKESMARLAGRKGPKTEAGYRKIPTTPRAQQIIDEHAQVYKELKGKCVGPVLLSRDGVPYSNLISCWHLELMNEVGLVKPGTKIPKFTFHGLRHWCASHWMKATGGDVHQVKTWLGHKNASMTLDIYGHCIDDPEAREKFQQMPDWLDPLVEIDAPRPVQPITIPESPRLLSAPEGDVMSGTVIEEKVDHKIGDNLYIPSIAEPWVTPFVNMLADGTPLGEAYDWVVTQLDDRRSVNDPTKRVTGLTAASRVTDEFRRLKLPSPKSLAARFLAEKIIQLHGEKYQAIDIAGICKCHPSRVYQILRDRGHKENANNPLGRKVNLASNLGPKPQPKHKEQLKLL